MGEGGATESLLGWLGNSKGLWVVFLLLFCGGTRSRKDELKFFFSGISKWFRVGGFFFSPPSGACVSWWWNHLLLAIDSE